MECLYGRFLIRLVKDSQDLYNLRNINLIKEDFLIITTAHSIHGQAITSVNQLPRVSELSGTITTIYAICSSPTGSRLQLPLNLVNMLLHTNLQINLGLAINLLIHWLWFRAYPRKSVFSMLTILFLRAFDKLTPIITYVSNQLPG